MAIPHDINAWMQNYWVERYGNFFANARSGRLEPFVLWWNPVQGGRELHEMAHLICCSDEHIWDSSYGLPEFVGVGEGWSRAAMKAEIEVIVVEEYIRKHIMGMGWVNSVRTPTWMGLPTDHWRTAPTSPQFISSLLFGLGPIPRHTVETLACKYIRKWDISTVWNELNRKYRLVDAELN